MSRQTTGEVSQFSPGLSLRQLLPHARALGGSDFQVRSCCGSWRECRPNDLYVAVEGPQEDGHDFVQDALQRGAAAVVSERLLAIPVPQFLVDDSRIAFGTICHALSGNPCRQLRTIGVAGTDGKTIISQLIRSILCASGYQTAAATTLRQTGNLWDQSDTAIPANSPSIAHWLAEAAAASKSHAVLEISSLTLAQHGLAGTQLDVAVLGNIRRDHLAFHGSEANYRDVQTRLLKYVHPEGTVVLNADDPYTSQLLDRLDFPALTIGIHQPAEIQAQMLDRDAGRQTFLLTAGGDTAVVSTEMIGKHHIYNCLTAAACGLALGIDLTAVVAGLEGLGQLPCRLEPLGSGEPFQIWIDSARRSSQLSAAIQAIGQEINGRVHVVATVPEEGLPDQRKRLGSVLERVADRVVLTQETANGCSDYEPLHQVLDGFDQPGQAQLIPNRLRAIHWALSQARAGDAVLIAGDGTMDIATGDEPPCLISDRDACLAFLQKRGDRI